MCAANSQWKGVRRSLGPNFHKSWPVAYYHVSDINESVRLLIDHGPQRLASGFSGFGVDPKKHSVPPVDYDLDSRLLCGDQR
jgi:hypothetical protein